MDCPNVFHNALRFLTAVQNKDGSFLSYSSSSQNNFSKAIVYETNFLNAFILLLLCDLPGSKELNRIKKKLAQFILSQKSDYWSWNYWTKNSPERKTTPYPDDLDDTFCSLSALTRFDNKIISPEVFAAVVKMLTATEKKEGGPYKTWLVGTNSQKVWKDVDIAVNANIAYFLSLHDIVLPNLTIFFDKSLGEIFFTSSYYPSSIQPLYFISRFYRGKRREKIVDLISQERTKKGQFNNPLDTALAILLFFNLNVENQFLERDIELLLATQKDGVWDAYGFCLDPSRRGEKYFAGSSPLTTVFCLLALYQYEERNKKGKLTKQEKEQQKYFDTIIDSVTRFFESKDRLIKKQGLKILKKIIAKDTRRHIPLFPHFFYQALGAKHKNITEKVLVQLGVANVFGWIAYTIYDDFLDEEGDPSLLSVANISLRETAKIFSAFENKNISKLYSEILDTIDAANIWEIHKCRDISNIPKIFPERKLAEKSVGHLLGPLTILLLMGTQQKNKEFIHIREFFIHFLIAKQLNDDAHDFVEDLQKGNITLVGKLLLERRGKKKKNDISYLKSLFWSDVVDNVVHLIYKHVTKAKKELNKITLVENKYIFFTMVEEFEKAAEKVREEKKNVTDFLKIYHK